MVSHLPSIVTSVVLSAFVLVACESTESATDVASVLGTDAQNRTAMITAVTYTGEPNNYTLSVGILSAETGCEQYADWWEVLKDDGSFVYRRVLTHSHVTEQPFTRTGGPVTVLADDNLIVRAHMNSTGYGTTVYRGSIQNGFTQDTLDDSFAAELEFAEPLPASCAF